MKVTLLDYEMAQGSTTGSLRHIGAIKRGYKNKTKLKSSWNSHIEGACGEIAVSKAMGKYWGGSINTFKSGGDIDGTGWEVRSFFRFSRPARRLLGLRSFPSPHITSRSAEAIRTHSSDA